MVQPTLLKCIQNAPMIMLFGDGIITMACIATVIPGFSALYSQFPVQFTLTTYGNSDSMPLAFEATFVSYYTLSTFFRTYGVVALVVAEDAAPIVFAPCMSAVVNPTGSLSWALFIQLIIAYVMIYILGFTVSAFMKSHQLVLPVRATLPKQLAVHTRHKSERFKLADDLEVSSSTRGTRSDSSDCGSLYSDRMHDSSVLMNSNFREQVSPKNVSGYRHSEASQCYISSDSEDEGGELLDDDGSDGRTTPPVPPRFPPPPGIPTECPTRNHQGLNI
jgi:hypothetical protein